MKKYLSFFRIRFVTGLSHRAAAWSGVFTQFFWGLLMILSFLAFYRSDPSAFSMDFSALCSYVWLQEAFLALFTLWRTDDSIFDAILSGNIAYELARPIGLYEMWFSKDIGAAFSNALLRFGPILLISALLPSPYNLSAPANVLGGVLFLPSLLLGSLLISAIRMLIYTATFHTLNPTGIRVFLISITEFLSGAIIPLPFFPDKLRAIIELTPFASMQSTPLLIYTGSYSPEKAIVMVLVQFGWTVLLIGLGKLWLERSLQRVVVQGG